MADDTLDYELATPVPTAELAKNLEEEFVDTAMKCGAATAYVKKIGDKWHFVAKFDSDNVEAFAHFCKLFQLPGLPPAQFRAKKASGNA